MKKLTTIFGVIIFASFIFTSCGGNSIESDAKRLAELQCKVQKLIQKAASGDMSIAEESQKLSSEAATLSKEMDGKYTSDSDKQKFAEALLKEMGNCNETSNSDKTSNSNETSNSGEATDCVGATQEELEVCYKNKKIEDLALFYCDWAKKEANSKEANDKEKMKEADNHTDAIQKIAKHREEDEKRKFKELTKGCKEHN